jgi:hypothetical protein
MPERMVCKISLKTIIHQASYPIDDPIVEVYLGSPHQTINPLSITFLKVFI